MSHERDCADVLQFRPRPGNTDEVADLRGKLRLMLSGNINLRTALTSAEWVVVGDETLLHALSRVDTEDDGARKLVLLHIADVLQPIASGDKPLVLACHRCGKSDRACNCCSAHRLDLFDCACDMVPDPPDREVYEDR